MDIEENVRLSKLFDLYAPLLSNMQVEVLSDYLIYNLTTSEIAQNKNVSRQAVNDAIEKGVKKLKIYEEKLGFAKKLDALQAQTKGRRK